MRDRSGGWQENGVDDGTRTHDDRDHNPGLYQLSYAHHRFCILLKASRSGAPGRTRTCNILLRRQVLYPVELRAPLERHPRSDKNSGRGRRIRTADPLLPKQMRYQTAPCPDARHSATRYPAPAGYFKPGRGRVLRGHDNTYGLVARQWTGSGPGRRCSRSNRV